MDKWVNKNGFPLITVKRENTGNKTTSLTLTQTTFSTTKKSKREIEEPWNVIISYSMPFNQSGQFVLDARTKTFELDADLEVTDWFKLNAGANGYYVVNYCPEDWDLLIEELKHNLKSFSSSDRANILFDAYRLTDISLMSYETLFKLFDYLKQENDYLPWEVAKSSLNKIESRLVNSGGMSAVQYKTYVNQLVGDVFDTNVEFKADPNKMSFEQMYGLNCFLFVFEFLI